MRKALIILLQTALPVFGLCFSLQSANADVICDGCEYLTAGTGDATWLGLYDPENHDSGSFFQDIELDNMSKLLGI